METNHLLKKKLKYLSTLNELDARHYVALWAMELGWGGVSRVHESTGMAMDTIRKGIREVNNQSTSPLKTQGRIRKVGGGRKKIISKDPEIKKRIDDILEESTAGDPMSALRWTNKSTYAVADELSMGGKKISEDTVRRIIKKEGYSLQANIKSKESGNSKERDSQFRYINTQVKQFSKSGNPIISVDTKKKEQIGNFKNQGQRWHKKGEAEIVNIYDFKNLSKGKAIPYGIYELLKNNGFVNVGMSHDTAEFAVESIREWWKCIGKKNYPNASALLICADGGGSNASRSRLWKYHLQELAKETKLQIIVCHYPPGTSKWNKIEHRMFSFISMNWKGKPLLTYEMIISLIRNTTTKTGLSISAKIDRKIYKLKEKLSKNEFEKINLQRHEINPQWNYTIS